MLIGDPLLLTRCSTYTRYTWNTLRFEYVPAVTSFASGNTMFALTSVPATPKSFEEASRFVRPLMSHIAQPVTYDVNAVTEDGSYISKESDDARHVIDFYLHFLWYGQENGALITRPGSLFLTYSVSLYGTRAEPATPMTRQFTATYTTQASTASKTTRYIYPDSSQYKDNVLSIGVTGDEATKIAVGDVLTGVGPASQLGFMHGTLLQDYDNVDLSALATHSTFIMKGATGPEEAGSVAGTAMVIWRVAKIIITAGGAILNVFGYASWADFFKGKKSVAYPAVALTNAYASSDTVKLTLVIKASKPEAQEGTFTEINVATE